MERISGDAAFIAVGALLGLAGMIEGPWMVLPGCLGVSAALVSVAAVVWAMAYKIPAWKFALLAAQVEIGGMIVGFSVTDDAHFTSHLATRMVGWGLATAVLAYVIVLIARRVGA